MAIRALWSKLWGRGVSITLQFSGVDAGGDKCKTCGKPRKFHRRGDDHVFKEKEDAK